MMFFGGLAVSFIGKGMLPQSAQDFMSENQLLVFGTRLRCNIMPLTLTTDPNPHPNPNPNPNPNPHPDPHPDPNQARSSAATSCLAS